MKLFTAILASMLICAFAPMLGCSTVTGAITPTAQKFVTRYCAEPADERALVRAQINAAIAPATIALTCGGDSGISR